MVPFEDYSFNVLGEPVRLKAKVKSGFRGGAIALTTSRLAFVRNKRGVESIDRAFPIDAISSSTLKKHLGTWQLHIEHGGKTEIFVGQSSDELARFVEPLQASADANAARLEAEERVRASAEEQARADRDAGIVDGHDTAVVGEPALLSARASSGFRSGVIVLTDTRLVYLRNKKGETFVDRESDRTEIVNLKYTKSTGTRSLSFDDGSDAVSYVQTAADLEPFVEPLQGSADANAARLEAEERVRASAEEQARADRDAGIVNGHDTAVVGEPALLSASPSSGWGSGVIVLTDNRLVYLRNKKGETFVDRESDRAAIGNVTYTKPMGSWSLSFDDGSDAVSYVQTAADLEPFVEPLQGSADANAARLEAEERVRASAEEQARADRDAGIVDGHDTAVVGEPALLSARASSGFRSGVIVLTDTRLVYLRNNKGETFVDRESDRAAIGNVTYTKSMGVWSLDFNDGSDAISFTRSSEDLEPFVEPLHASADANADRLEAEERVRASAEEQARVDRDAGIVDGHDTAVVGEPTLLSARASSGWHSGVIVLTDTRLVYLRNKKGETFVDRESDRAAIGNVTYTKPMGSWSLSFDDGSDAVSYVQTADDLEPFVGPLQVSAEANAARFEEEEHARLAAEKQERAGRDAHTVDGYDLRAAGEPVSLVARAKKLFSNGLLISTNRSLVFLRRKSSKTYVDLAVGLNRITGLEYDKSLKTLQIEFAHSPFSEMYESRKGDDLEKFLEPLKQSATADIEPTITYNGIDVSVLDEPALYVAEAERKVIQQGVVVLTATRFAFLRKRREESFVHSVYERKNVSEVNWNREQRELTFVTGSDQDAYVSHDPKFKHVVNELIRDMESNEAQDGVILSARGSNGTVHLFDDRIVITKIRLDLKSLNPGLSVSDFVDPAKVFTLSAHRKALKLFNSDVGPEARRHEILLRDITSVGWKEPGVTDGHIQFGYVGTHTPANLVSKSNNAIQFKSAHMADFEKLRRTVEEKRSELVRSQSVAVSGPSPMDELKKLAELKELGVVTDEEFELKKKQLLGL